MFITLFIIAVDNINSFGLISALQYFRSKEKLLPLLVRYAVAIEFLYHRARKYIAVFGEELRKVGALLG